MKNEDNRQEPMVVGIAGGTGSGKTTLSELILDRVGHQYFPTVGYKGGLHLLTRILDLLLTRTDRDETEEKLELVY